MFTIPINGDNYEKEAYDIFLKNKFPSYELFWQKFITILSNLPTDVHTKSDDELIKIFPGESIEMIHERVIILQLHYSVLRMLFKAHKDIKKSAQDMDAVINFFASIYSAIDISAELFGRYDRFKKGVSIVVDPFDPVTSQIDSMKIRKGWQKNNPYSQDIIDIRTYRNLMSHGQAFGSVSTFMAGFIALPEPGRIEEFLDWRTINWSSHVPLVHTNNLIPEVFDSVVKFLNKEWERNLL